MFHTAENMKSIICLVYVSHRGIHEIHHLFGLCLTPQNHEIHFLFGLFFIVKLDVVIVDLRKLSELNTFQARKMTISSTLFIR